MFENFYHNTNLFHGSKQKFSNLISVVLLCDNPRSMLTFENIYQKTNLSNGSPSAARIWYKFSKVISIHIACGQISSERTFENFSKVWAEDEYTFSRIC